MISGGDCCIARTGAAFCTPIAVAPFAADPSAAAETLLFDRPPYKSVVNPFFCFFVDDTGAPVAIGCKRESVNVESSIEIQEK